MERNKNNILSNRKIQEAIFFLIISISLMIYSLKNHYSTLGLQWKISPYLFPLLIAIFIGLLSISLFIEGIRDNRSLDKGNECKCTNTKWKDVLFTILVSVSYYIAMGLIGFIASTLIFLVALFIYLGEKRIWLIALISIISTLSVYIIFGVLLHVMLP